jgi:hypothetical protein
MNMEWKWKGFFWKRLPLDVKENRELFFLENLDILEEILEKLVARIAKKEEEIKERERYDFSALKIFFRAQPQIMEKDERFQLKNFSGIGEKEIIYLNLEEFKDDALGLDIEGIETVFTLDFLVSIFQSQNLAKKYFTKEYSKKEISRVVSGDLIELTLFIFAKNYLGDNQLARQVRKALEIKKEMIRRIFQRLQFTRNKKRQRKISGNLKEALVDLILFSKEAEILENQKLKGEITRETNQLIARGNTQALRKELEEVRKNFSQAEGEIRKRLLSADFDYWLPETYELERRKKILVKVLEKKAPELISEVESVQNNLQWNQVITEIKQKTRITPIDIEGAEQLIKK